LRALKRHASPELASDRERFLALDLNAPIQNGVPRNE
jgi:hypothetical protein